MIFLIIYNLLLIFLIPVIFGYFLHGKLILGKYKMPLRRRLGLTGVNLKKSNNILIHAVSVGETVAAMPFVKELKKQYPDSSIIFSTVTETGQLRAKEVIEADAFVFFPVDYRLAIRTFLESLKIGQVFILETEIWPNFLDITKRKNIPVTFINARISDKSFKHYSFFKGFFKPFLKIPLFYAQSELDKERLLALGASKVKVVGNLKYDQLLINLDSPIRQKLKEEFSVLNKEKLVIFGSLHREESLLALDTILEMKNRGMDFKFILAPRHMHFLDKYLEYAKSLNLKVLLRSDYKKEVDFDVLILNTYGELAFFYELARFCLIGGSFENIGGHSILEPAIFAPVIFYGPHMQNFRETSLKFEEAGASIRLKDFKDLVANLEILALNKDLCLTMGEIAKGLALANSGVTKRILKDLVTKVPELT